MNDTVNYFTASYRWKTLLMQITCSRKDFETKKLVEYHDSYVQSDTL